MLDQGRKESEKVGLFVADEQYRATFASSFLKICDEASRNFQEEEADQFISSIKQSTTVCGCPNRMALFIGLVGAIGHDFWSVTFLIGDLKLQHFGPWILFLWP